MTKAVRIENADLSPYKVKVEVWERRYAAPDVLVTSVILDHPTAMTGSEIYLTKERYIVVMEVD